MVGTGWETDCETVNKDLCARLPMTHHHYDFFRAGNSCATPHSQIDSPDGKGRPQAHDD